MVPSSHPSPTTRLTGVQYTTTRQMKEGVLRILIEEQPGSDGRVLTSPEAEEWILVVHGWPCNSVIDSVVSVQGAHPDQLARLVEIFMAPTNMTTWRSRNIGSGIRWPTRPVLEDKARLHSDEGRVFSQRLTLLSTETPRGRSLLTHLLRAAVYVSSDHRTAAIIVCTVACSESSSIPRRRCAFTAGLCP